MEETISLSSSFPTFGRSFTNVSILGKFASPKAKKMNARNKGVFWVLIQSTARGRWITTGKEFTASLLHPDPNRRSTAEEALRHPVEYSVVKKEDAKSVSESYSPLFGSGLQTVYKERQQQQQHG
jgi:hypothetical protein